MCVNATTHLVPALCTLCLRYFPQSTITCEEVLLFLLLYVCRNVNMSHFIAREDFIYAAMCLLQNYIYLVLG